MKYFFKENTGFLILIIGYAIVFLNAIIYGAVIGSEIICIIFGIISMIMAIKRIINGYGQYLAVDIICILLGNPFSQILLFIFVDIVLFVDVLQALGQMG